MAVGTRRMAVAILAVGLVAAAIWWWGLARSRPLPLPPPQKVAPFAIYYGWMPPGSEAFSRLARQLGRYHWVILGDGLELPLQPENGPARRLIRLDRHTRFWGYVSVGLNHGNPGYKLQDLHRRFAWWKRLGVQGILLDSAGPDFGVSPARLAAAMTDCHQLGLSVLVNAWDPISVLNSPWKPGDGYLAENWGMSAGHQEKERDYGVLRATGELFERGVVIAGTATVNSPRQIKPAVSDTLRVVPGMTWLSVGDSDYGAESGLVTDKSALIRSLGTQVLPGS